MIENRVSKPAGYPKRCVIASHHSWNRDMVDRLMLRTGWAFSLISNPLDMTVESLDAIQPSYVFFPHWSHRIKDEIFERYECVIFHMTDLPYGRGGTPLQNLIALGHEATQISALRCVSEMDAGPIYLKRPLCLHGSAEEIYLRAARIIEEMIVSILKEQQEPVPQAGEVVTFERRIPEDGNLDQCKSLDEVFDLIRMLDAEGYPLAFLQIGPFRFELSRASRKVDSVLADVRISLSE